MSVDLQDKKKFLIVGTTGAGKTYFVENLQKKLNGGARVLYVPQIPLFRPAITVAQFIEVLPAAVDREDTFNALAKLGIPKDSPIGGKYFGVVDFPGLSGGQRKKFQLVVVSALLKSDTIPFVVLDEPFAGCDKGTFPEVLQILLEAAEYTNLVVVSHDHLPTLKDAGFTVLSVENRIITNESLGLDLATDEAVPAFFDFFKSREPKVFSAKENGFAQELLHFEWSFCTIYAREGDWMIAGAVSLMSALCQGIAANAYVGAQIEDGGVWAFEAAWCYEFSHFMSIVLYCWKQGLHIEDYNLGVSKKKFMFYERFVCLLVQNALLMCVCEGIKVAFANTLYNVGIPGLLVLYLNAVFSGLAHNCFGILTLNPIIVMAFIYPYAAFWGFSNGLVTPTHWMAGGYKWTAYFSNPYQIGCSVIAATDKIDLPGTECYATWPHFVMISPLFWCVGAFFIVLSMLGLTNPA